MLSPKQHRWAIRIWVPDLGMLSATILSVSGKYSINEESYFEMFSLITVPLFLLNLISVYFFSKWKVSYFVI